MSAGWFFAFQARSCSLKRSVTSVTSLTASLYFELYCASCFFAASSFLSAGAPVSVATLASYSLLMQVR